MTSTATSCDGSSTRISASSGSPALAKPARSAAAIARFERSAVPLPRSSAALPALTHRPAASDVTFGPVLVDDRDDAERDPHLLDLEPVRADPAADDLADRVGERRDLAQAGGHGVDARVGEAQPVERPGSIPRGRGRVEIGGVGGEDLAGLLDQQVGGGVQARRSWPRSPAVASTRDARRRASQLEHRVRHAPEHNENARRDSDIAEIARA